MTSSDEIQRQWLSSLREKGLVSDENLHRAWQHRSEERDVLDLLTQGALISPAQAAQLRSQSSASDSASDGRRFGDYLLEKELSRGGMGVVYRARSASTGRLVALKVILAESPSIEDQRRFEREVATLIRLSHPNIVQILDSGTHDQRPFLAMDLVEGQSLLSVLEKEPLEVDAALRILEPIAEALQICARSGIIHRDLKPANIMIRKIDETPILIDFGIVKDLNASQLTRSSQSLGTPAYMAPEQLDSSFGAISEKSDVWAWAATLYASLTGEPPVEGESYINLVRNVLSHDRPRLSAARKDVPEWLDELCAQCLSRSPERRPGWDELIDAIEQGPQRRARSARRGRAGLFVLTVIALLGLALAAIAALTFAPQGPPPLLELAPRFESLTHSGKVLKLAGRVLSSRPDKVKFEIDGSPWHVLSCNESGDFQLERELPFNDREKIILSISALDQYGRESSRKTLELQLDSSPPELKTNFPAPIAFGAWTIGIKAPKEPVRVELSANGTRLDDKEILEFRSAAGAITPRGGALLWDGMSDARLTLVRPAGLHSLEILISDRAEQVSKELFEVRFKKVSLVGEFSKDSLESRYIADRYSSLRDALESETPNDQILLAPRLSPYDEGPIQWTREDLMLRGIAGIDSARPRVALRPGEWTFAANGLVIDNIDFIAAPDSKPVFPRGVLKSALDSVSATNLLNQLRTSNPKAILEVQGIGCRLTSCVMTFSNQLLLALRSVEEGVSPSIAIDNCEFQNERGLAFLAGPASNLSIETSKIANFEIAILCDQGSRLTIQKTRLDSGSRAIGLTEQARIEADELSLLNITQRGVEFDGGTGAAKQCSFSGRAGLKLRYGFQGGAWMLAEGASIVVEDSQISNWPHAGVAVFDESSAQFTNCQFKNIEGGGLFLQNHSEAKIKKSTFDEVGVPLNSTSEPRGIGWVLGVDSRYKARSNKPRSILSLEDCRILSSKANFEGWAFSIQDHGLVTVKSCEYPKNFKPNRQTRGGQFKELP